MDFSQQVSSTTDNECQEIAFENTANVLKEYAGCGNCFSKVAISSNVYTEIKSSIQHEKAATSMGPEVMSQKETDTTELPQPEVCYYITKDDEPDDDLSHTLSVIEPEKTLGADCSSIPADCPLAAANDGNHTSNVIETEFTPETNCSSIAAGDGCSSHVKTNVENISASHKEPEPILINAEKGEYKMKRWKKWLPIDAKYDFTKIADHSSNKAVKMRSLERLRRNEEWVKNKKLYQAKLHKTYVRPCDRNPDGTPRQKRKYVRRSVIKKKEKETIITASYDVLSTMKSTLATVSRAQCPDVTNITPTSASPTPKMPKRVEQVHTEPPHASSLKMPRRVELVTLQECTSPQEDTEPSHIPSPCSTPPVRKENTEPYVFKPSKPFTLDHILCPYDKILQPAMAFQWFEERVADLEETGHILLSRITDPNKRVLPDLEPRKEVSTAQLFEEDGSDCNYTTEDNSDVVSLTYLPQSRRRLDSSNHSAYSEVPNSSNILDLYDDEEDEQTTSANEMSAYRQVTNEDIRELAGDYWPGVPIVEPRRSQRLQNAVNKVGKLYAASDARLAFFPNKC